MNNTMVRERVVRENDSALIAHSSQIQTLLADERYDELIAFLRSLRTERLRQGDTIVANALLAMIQVCLACAEAQKETIWREKALVKAKHRKFELLRILGKIVADVSAANGSTPEATLEDSQLPPFDEDLFETAPHYRLWQRFQSLIGPWSDRQSLTATPKPLHPHTIATLATLTVLIDGLDKKAGKQALVAYFLGPFEVYLNETHIDDLGSRKGKLIFKYLLINRARRIPKEILMDQFWPDAEPDAARNNLNVAIYGLRRALRQDESEFSHILFQDDWYFINPDLLIWMDYEKFLEAVEDGDQSRKAGKQAQAIQYYRSAETLYRGTLLEEDTYEEWLIPFRQNLQTAYLSVLNHLSQYYLEQQDFTACIHTCNKIIEVDGCREEAHRQLMECYSLQGQHYLALRQYHTCVDALKRELDTLPSSEFHSFYEQIRTKTLPNPPESIN